MSKQEHKMTEETKKVLEEKMRVAKNNNQFIRVHGKGGNLNMTDAQHYFKDGVMFNIRYRVAGTQQQLEDFAVKHNVSKETILKDCITSQNHTSSMKDEYEHELELAKRRRMSPSDLEAFLNAYKQQKKKQNEIDAQKREKDRIENRNRKNKTLQEKISELPSEKVFDVTHYQENGTMLKPINRPTENSRKVSLGTSLPLSCLFYSKVVDSSSGVRNALTALKYNATEIDSIVSSLQHESDKRSAPAPKASTKAKPKKPVANFHLSPPKDKKLPHSPKLTSPRKQIKTLSADDDF